jgi:hypothetical protein
MYATIFKTTGALAVIQGVSAVPTQGSPAGEIVKVVSTVATCVAYIWHLWRQRK